MSRSALPAETAPVADSELSALFDEFLQAKKILLAVSGGPDSTALMVLAARWRAKRGDGPELVAATVDHGLRAASKKEAQAVAKFAAKLEIPHHILEWKGKKPKTGLQEAARTVRFTLLGDLARKLSADVLMTAHTRDDQAETVLHRIARGSGISGLGGIRRRRLRDRYELVRPLLDLPKTRLIATLKRAHISFAKDPTNRDEKYLRPRLRKLAPLLAKEGIDAANLALIAKRLARADEALEVAADVFAESRAKSGSGFRFNAYEFFILPEEISIRALRRTIDQVGREGPAELGKVESLYSVLREAHGVGEALRRTLAGALVSLNGAALIVAAAPPRRT